MNINFTIVVQAINFFICFILLRQLLFKPAVKYLQSEDKKEEGVTAKITIEKYQLNEKVEIKSKTWKKYQKSFQKNCPQLSSQETIPLKNVCEIPENIEISHKEIEDIAEHVQKALIERIQHVHK